MTKVLQYLVLFSGLVAMVNVPSLIRNLLSRHTRA